MIHPYLPLTEPERRQMLERIGVATIEDLLQDLPQQVRLPKELNLDRPLTEPELKKHFQEVLNRNQPVDLSFVGAGAYQHYIPSIVNHLAGRSEFYTAYTPYQPEISQGMLQAIFEYQTFVAELFGLPVANASLYDGPTALAEAVLMAVRETQNRRVLIAATLDPRILQVLRTYTKNLGVELKLIPCESGRLTRTYLEPALQPGVAAVVFQNPNYYGLVEDLPELLPLTSTKGAVPICYVQPMTLGLLEAPGHLGAEIVVAEGQPLGLPLSYGGPYLGMMAVSERFLRRLPGRLVGESVDAEGRRAFVLTLQTREQHIRREKATSNICSNQALCALRAAIYLSVIGPSGLAEIAKRSFDNAHYLQKELAKIGLKLLYDGPFIMEFAVQTPQPAAYYLDKLQERGISPGYDLGQTQPELDHALLICTTEIHSRADLDRLVAEMRCLL